MSVTYKIKKTRARVVVRPAESRERRDKSTTKEEEGRRKKKERQD